MTKKTKTTKTTKRINIPAAKFVGTVNDVFKAGGSHAEIANLLGIKQTSVATRCSQLRKAGVNLPNFKRGGGGRRLDVAALNDILAS